MSRSGGTYTAPSSSWNPAVEGTPVDETDWNTLRDDIAAALTESTYTSGLGSSDNRIVRTDGTDAKKVQGSAVSIDDSGNISTAGSITVGNTGVVVGSSTPFSDSSGTLTLQNVDALDATTEATIEAAMDTLANVTSIQGRTITLADAGADAFLGWDDSAAAYENLTSAEATAILDAVVGDSGAGGTKGLVPAPSAGDAAANKFLKADGTWVAPAGSGDLLSTNNLSDVADAPTSRSNLGITAAGDSMVTAANAAAQTALLDAVVGDSGSGGTKGLVPAPAAGDAAANKFLKADGTWVAPAGSGDMLAATYDPATISEQLVGLTATQTLTNKTITTPTLTLKQSASPTPTAEGDIQWDTDGNFIVVGDGASQQLFYPAIDEDTMSSDSATRVPTQQSVKAYVDANAGGGGGLVTQGRLTLTTGVPVTTSTVAATGTLYFTPYQGNICHLYNGSSWDAVTFAETSIALSGGTASKLHDVWAYNNSGTLALELTAWTSDTARATAIALQDGRYVKSGAATRLYLGTVYIDGSNQAKMTIPTAAASGGTAGWIGVWNYYNRRPWVCWNANSDTSWTTVSATYTRPNTGTPATGMQTTYVVGVAEDMVYAQYEVWTTGTTNGRVAIGYDSTTSPSGSQAAAVGQSNTINGRATYGKMAAVGLHYLAAIEFGNNPSTVTFYGDNGSTTLQSGMEVWGWA